MIYIHKILPFFFLPIGATSILIAAGVISHHQRWCLTGLGLLWVCAMPVVSDQMMRAVEGRSVRMPAEAMPEADVIVVLSSQRIRAPGDSGVMEWQDPDRVLGGIAGLLKKRKEAAFPPKVLLVTSAYHMRRSTLLFEQEGLEVIPFPVDFQVATENEFTILDLMPRADALRQTEKLFLWLISSKIWPKMPLEHTF